jgi:Mg2+ and Co2+ transporter CorA
MQNELCVRHPEEMILERLIGDKDISPLSVVERIMVIEKAMKESEFQIEIPVGHSFADGLYLRQVVIPKGTLLTSKFHKYDQIDVMLAGDMSIVSNDGIVRVKAPMIAKSGPGLKRLGYAHEETVWITVHATRETDIEMLEKTLFLDTAEELEAFLQEEEDRLWLGSQQQ